MSPDTEFINFYIQRLVKEIEELTKTRLLNEARLAFFEKINQTLLDKNTELEEQIERLKKKTINKKEVDTSE